MTASFTTLVAAAILAAVPVAQKPASFVVGASAATAEPAPTQLALHPANVRLDDKRDRQRIVVVAAYADGTTRDVTADAEITVAEPLAALDDDHSLRPLADGATVLVAAFGGQVVKADVTVKRATEAPPISFANDVMPVLTRAGCNAGTCHGAASGKNGFGLSLFAYDKNGDHLALTREMRGRRLNVASPEESLMLRKPTGAVTHKGGKRLEKGSPLYRMLCDWIEDGANNDLDKAPTLVGIDLQPQQAVIKGAGGSQRLVVTARYADGSDRDVTGLALLSSSNDSVADVDEAGVVAAKERGETFVMARFGTFALVTQVLVLPAKDDFAWPADLKPFNEIDELIFDKLQKQRLVPAGVCDDATFVRRVYLDVLNILPTAEDSARFIADASPHKRSALVDALLERPEFPDVWAMEWAEMLRIEPDRLIGKNMYAYDGYLRDAFRERLPVDKITRELLTTSGSSHTEPASNFYLVERSSKGLAETVAHVFMGVRIQCAQCHNHPFERWTMDDYYGFAAFFTQVTNKRGEDPYERVVYDRGSGSIRHPVTNAVSKPRFLGGAEPEIAKGTDRRAVLADWLTSPDNEFFAANIANRVFARFFGRGVVSPTDDVRVSNPPSHPALHRKLGEKLVAYGFDLRKLIRDLCASRTYQIAAADDPPPASTFASAPIRRLTSEQLLDAIGAVTGVPTKYSRVPLGGSATRVVSPDGSTFLRTFGRPARDSSCTCDRRSEPTLSQVLHLINGKTTTDKLRSKSGRLQKLLAAKADDAAILKDLYLAAYSREPSDDERERLLAGIPADGREAAWEDLFWAVLNSREFLFNH